MEGAQGSLLDIDFGTYPYTTSSHVIAAGSSIGTGIGIKEINEIIEDIKRNENICKIDISPSPDGGVLGSIVTKKCVACQALTGSNCFLTSAKTKSDGP